MKVKTTLLHPTSGTNSSQRKSFREVWKYISPEGDPDLLRVFETLLAITTAVSPATTKKPWFVDTEIRRTKTWKRRRRGKKRDRGLEDRAAFYGNGFRFVEVRGWDIGWDYYAGYDGSRQKAYKDTRPTDEIAGKYLMGRTALDLAEDLNFEASCCYPTGDDEAVRRYQEIGVLGIEKWPTWK
ncbi:hypothetical protein DL546_002189 [Coniochaeta pulveracea]|uniref:Uncharacterized protein n=1 Tax=Coniochaeta pulveracea TaxID=177199 RepID=A0A420XZF9_9PEZI|nr:hypothetical protein DL546_002189 [Coniochaeta pulveracea]